MAVFWFLLIDLVGCIGIALVLTLLTGPDHSRDERDGPALIPPPHRPANARSA